MLNSGQEAGGGVREPHLQVDVALLLSALEQPACLSEEHLLKSRKPFRAAIVSRKAIEQFAEALAHHAAAFWVAASAFHKRSANDCCFMPTRRIKP